MTRYDILWPSSHNVFITLPDRNGNCQSRPCATRDRGKHNKTLLINASRPKNKRPGNGRGDYPEPLDDPPSKNIRSATTISFFCLTFSLFFFFLPVVIIII